MTRTMKLVFLGLGIASAIILIILLKPPSASITTGDYTIEDGHVGGELVGRLFTVTLDAKIIVGDQIEFVEGKGKRVDYLSHRVEILENIFGSIQGIKALTSGEEGYYISSVEELDNYVQTMQAIGTSPENTPYDIVQEDLAFGEMYLKDGKNFAISHRDNQATFWVPIGGNISPEVQVEKMKEFAGMFMIEEYFDFDNPIDTDEGIIVPIRVDGLPIVARSYDYLLDKFEEAYVLQYLGYDRMHLGLSSELIGDRLVIRLIRPVIPVDTNIAKHPVITIQQAIEALIENLDSVYIDNQIPQGREFIVSKIQLAYAAIYDREGLYSLKPVYVFEHKTSGEWDYCFFVDAITGYVFPAIDGAYAANVLNPSK